jgi:hypothetical protein
LLAAGVRMRRRLAEYTLSASWTNDTRVGERWKDVWICGQRGALHRKRRTLTMSAMEQDLPAAKCMRGVEEEVMGPKKGVPSSQETW